MKFNNPNNWMIKEQSLFLKRLGYLLQRGYSLSTGIEFLMLHQPRKRKEDLNTILSKLKQGTAFFDILNQLNFSKDGLSFIYFAVSHGDLPTGLVSAGDLLEKKLIYKNKLYKVLRYPVFLIIFVILLSIIMQNILLPQFMSLQQSINLPQSRISKLILLLQIDFTQIIITSVAVVLSLLLFYFGYFKVKDPIHKQRFLCKLPIIGGITRKYNTYTFSFHLGTLLVNGLSINQALSVFEEQNHLLFFRDESRRIRKFLLEGERLENILSETMYYENELATIIVHGQANGILANELIDYSHLVIENLENTFKLWLKILQPAIILFIGLLVILMYLAVMLPLYGMMQNL